MREITEDEYHQKLVQIEMLMENSPPGSMAEARLLALVSEAEAYELAHYPELAGLFDDEPPSIS